MATWEKEIVGDEIVPVDVGENKVVHVRSVYLGKVKKGTSELVHVYATVDDKKFLIASLHPEYEPEAEVYVVFDKKFELSHSMKEESVWCYYFEVNQPKITRNEEAKKLPFCKLCRSTFKTKGDLSSHSQDKHRILLNRGKEKVRSSSIVLSFMACSNGLSYSVFKIDNCALSYLL